VKTKPVVILIAGPNGSGKTTITEQLRKHAWMDGCVYVNPDIIAEEKFGGWNLPEASLKAAQEAERIRRDCFAKRKSVAFESVFSAPDKLRFVRAAVKAGYFVRLFFICTESPEINASRILGRRLEGGHDVPLEKIYSRFAKSIAQCAVAIRWVDRAYVYDNSIGNEAPALLFRSKNGQLVKRYAGPANWAKPILDRLRKK